jgi:hypothetical protein
VFGGLEKLNSRFGFTPVVGDVKIASELKVVA